MVEEIISQVGDFLMAHKGIALIVGFLAKHANFIIGAIINLIIIGVLCKLVGAFNNKLEKRLLEKSVYQGKKFVPLSKY